MEGHGKRILVVDDDDGARWMLSDLLGHAGYNVYLAVNGIEAIKEMVKRRHDLVLSDYYMPQVDGQQFLDVSRILWPEIPVVMMSCDAAGLAGLVTRRGAFACIEKPYDSERLLKIVRSALERTPCSKTGHPQAGRSAEPDLPESASIR